ncbi:hypothetical protein F2Q68_00011397 [Brassica cretica]|uniref:Uncharacterized protein n=1 Tax=Brassica cretica TaxID=69181 RepID=A0A8S9KYP9_BRACR|nr:hypothetical protein F2Q68_00011397 [Brassica cretica]
MSHNFSEDSWKTLGKLSEDFSGDSWKTLERLLGKSSNALNARRRPTKSPGSLPKFKNANFFRYELNFGRFLRRLLEDSQKISEDSWQTHKLSEDSLQTS